MHVKFFATYRDITGLKRMEAPAQPDVLALLAYLSERWPAFRPLLLNEAGDKIGDDAIVIVNGRHVDHLAFERTPLADDDTVALTPLVAGG